VEVEHAARIVLPADSAPPVNFAAQELVRYISAMGNPKPEVADAPAEADIYLGVLPDDLPAQAKQDLGDSLRGKDEDSFVIHSFGRRLVIFGNSARANLYGSYHYLETLGVRWYFPGAENECVPHRAPKFAGYKIVGVPSFHKRGIVIFWSTPGFADLVDFAAKMKLNTIGLHAIPFGPQMDDVGLAEASRVTEPRGLTIDIERHFFGENFCPDDAASLERERTRLVSYVAKLPVSMNDFFLWTADKVLSPCSSPGYEDYTVSDFALSFANRMEDSLRQSRPRARLAFLSYLNTWASPRHQIPSEGLILEWAPIFQSFGQSFDDPASATNAEYRRDFEKLLGLFARGNSQVLAYWLDDTLFSRTHYARLPYNPTALQGDLLYYHRMGVPAITTFGVMTGRDYFLYHASPAAFLYPRLLWKVDLGPRETMREFCRVYFDSERALEVFDLLAEADRMVYVERHRMHAERLNAPEFVAKVSKALKLAQEILDDQKSSQMRARSARLIQEVASRWIHPAT